MIGPYVFGDQRQSLWVAENSNLTDKLIHFLPRLRVPIPNLTDLFLPESATKNNVAQVRGAGFFAHLYTVAHGDTALQLSARSLAAHKRIGAGALEIDFEGSGIGGDLKMSRYIVDTVQAVRKVKPLLPLRVNVTPYKGGYIPVNLINADPRTALAVQCYGGNMDALYSVEDVVGEVVRWGVNPAKVVAMQAVMCAQIVGGTREVTLPQSRNIGAYYIDDLLLDAGLLPS
jgi:hypothetical protein